MTVIIGWRNRPAPAKTTFSDDAAFSGRNAKNAARSMAANERKERMGLGSINTEPLSPIDKRRKLVKAGI